MNTLLLTTDFSENARKAIDYVIKMVGTKDLRYILLHTYSTPATLNTPRDASGGKEQKEIEQRLDEEKDKIREMVGDGDEGALQMETIVRWGDLENVIEDIVTSYDVDLVVMGTQGRSGLKRAFVGSSTAKVATRVGRPLLAVPENCDRERLERILLTSDNKGLGDASALEPLKEIVRRFHAQILILNVLEEGKLPSTDQAAEGIRLDHYLEGYPHTYHFIESNNVEDGIDRFVEENSVDLIVTINRSRALLDKLLGNSVSKEMVHHTRLPLLVLHDK